MGFRDYLKQLEERGDLVRVGKATSKIYQIAGVMQELQPTPVLFTNVREVDYQVAGNLFSSKAVIADYFGIAVTDIIPFLSRAIDQRSKPEVVNHAPCQEFVVTDPDLNQIPILRHLENDGGNYITSGVFVARHPEYGQNLDFHRCMQFSAQDMAVRVVKGRHFDQFLEELGQVDVAICVGNSPNVLVAGAISVDLGVDELEIANAMQPLQVVRGQTVDLFIPAEAEFVIEGTVYRDRRHAEGPFVDLTETHDVIRQEPVFQVKAITHRQDAIWHALLPGGLEHKLLMGMPREPVIFKHVNQVVECLDVNVNPGGCSWLHAIVQIRKQSDDDGRKAIQAAFAGHRSGKHVYVVDEDIDIYDPLCVEWAMATRFQGDRDLHVYERERGSSLDPSAELGTHLTTKIGFDLTKPLGEEAKHYEKVAFPEVNVDDFLA
jgi:2,5-furandicarboxylate decarboxylase 1